MSSTLDSDGGGQLGRSDLLLALDLSFFAACSLTLCNGRNLNHMFFLQEYAELLHEFMTAVKQIYGEKVLIQV